MMERGYQFRNALDSLVQAEITEWTQFVIRRTRNGTKSMPERTRKKPSVVDDKISRIGCKLGWMKLDQYYTLTGDSPAYLAALVLHPAFRWATVESQWADHADWLARGKDAVQELWKEYPEPSCRA